MFYETVSEETYLAFIMEYGTDSNITYAYFNYRLAINHIMGYVNVDLENVKDEFVPIIDQKTGVALLPLRSRGLKVEVVAFRRHLISYSDWVINYDNLHEIKRKDVRIKINANGTIDIIRRWK